MIHKKESMREVREIGVYWKEGGRHMKESCR